MNPTIFTKAVSTAFYTGLDAYTPMWDQVATKAPSTGAYEDYAWLGTLPRVRKFRGERVPKALANYGYTIRNEEYEATLEVKQIDIDDDQTGKYGPLAQQIGESFASFPDELIFQNLIPNGFSALAYDGQPFFSNSHVDTNSGVQTNLLNNTLSAASFGTARSMIRRLKDDQARPVNQQVSLVLVVPPELQATAESILNQEKNAAGADNIYYNSATILVNPWLTSTTQWFLLNTTGVVKPFILQERQNEPFAALLTRPDGQGNQSETGFMRRVNYYGAYWRGNAGYGLWQKAVGSTGTV